MNSNRNNTQWIIIAILLYFNICIGEQALTCDFGKFSANVGVSLPAAVDTCIELKYKIYDVEYYDASYVGQCPSTTEKLALYGQIYKGCVTKTELTYLCQGYSRTVKSDGSGLYACIGCIAGEFKYIVPAAVLNTKAVPAATLNPLGVTSDFAKACTVELIPNCLTYTIAAAKVVVTAGTRYADYYIMQCTACRSGITATAITELFYLNAGIYGSTDTPTHSRLGKACPLPQTVTKKACTTWTLSVDRQGYDCEGCGANALFQYQQGEYNELCATTASIQYYDAECVLYDNYNSSKTVADEASSKISTGNCIKCRDPTTHDLLKVKDTNLGSQIIRNACIPKTLTILKQACTSYSWNPTTSALVCTGCPGGYSYDTTQNVCVLDDRYIKVANCKVSSARVSATSTSISCGTCQSSFPTPYCTIFTNTDQTDSTGTLFFGTKCRNTDSRKLQIAGTFFRQDTNVIASVYACVTSPTAVIDACASYRLTIGFVAGSQPPKPSPTNGQVKIFDSPYSCDACYSGYTRVLSQTPDQYICIKNELVDKNCGTYYILTLSCQTCVTGSAIDPVTRRCKAPSDYTANCASATTDRINAADGTIETRYRCNSCIPTFTLVRIGEGYFCVPTVFGCANFTIAGVCSLCASPNQQLVAGKFCVTLPLNCKSVASNGTCIDCKDGFIFNTVTSACLQVSASGSNSQVFCPDGQYFDSNGVCIVGPVTNCAKYTISGASVKCSQCTNGYHTSNFGGQCDMNGATFEGGKCQDQPAGDSYVWYLSPQSGACLKKDKRCGIQSYEDLANQMVYCGTCDDPKYYQLNGRCYLYDISSTSAVANN